MGVAATGCSDSGIRIAVLAGGVTGGVDLGGGAGSPEIRRDHQSLIFFFLQDNYVVWKVLNKLFHIGSDVSMGI